MLLIRFSLTFSIDRLVILDGERENCWGLYYNICFYNDIISLQEIARRTTWVIFFFFLLFVGQPTRRDDIRATGAIIWRGVSIRAWSLRVCRRAFKTIITINAGWMTVWKKKKTYETELLYTRFGIHARYLIIHALWNKKKNLFGQKETERRRETIDRNIRM